MDKQSAISSLDALAHVGRIDLFQHLVRAGPDGVAAGDLARAVGANFTTASAQLSILTHAKLITRRREGRSVIYAPDFAAIAALFAFLMEDCCQGRSEILGPLAALTTNAACCGQSNGETE